jgi:hypothetical protein
MKLRKWNRQHEMVFVDENYDQHQKQNKILKTLEICSENIIDVFNSEKK